MFTQPVHMGFVDLNQANSDKKVNHVSLDILWGLLWDFGSTSLCSGSYSPCMVRAAVWFAFHAVSHLFHLVFHGEEYFLGTTRNRRKSKLETT